MGGMVTYDADAMYRIRVGSDDLVPNSGIEAFIRGQLYVRKDDCMGLTHTDRMLTTMLSILSRRSDGKHR